MASRPETPTLKRLFANYLRAVREMEGVRVTRAWEEKIAREAASGRAEPHAHPRGDEVELEARFQRVDYPIFEATLQALAAGGLGAGPGEITQMINSVMPEDPRAVRNRDRWGHERANLIKQVRFAGGRRIPGDRGYRKRALFPPFEVKNPFALNYKVVLSVETDLGDERPQADAGATIRAKLRVSFPLGVAGPTLAARGKVAPGPAAERPLERVASWRADLTITREIRGSEAGSLAGVAAEMFLPGLTPANLLARLGLDDPDSTTRPLYRYEIELEYVGPQRRGEDDARFAPAYLQELAGSLLRLANPQYLQTAAYQAEVYQVAQYVITDAPGLLQRFEYEAGVRDLTLAVRSLTRVEYKDIYPPLGYWATDKADGLHAVASARGSRLALLADQLREFVAPGRKPGRPERSQAEDPAEGEATTVVLGELVAGAKEADLALHVYDVIVDRGLNVAGEPFEVRHGHLAKAVKALQGYGLKVEAKPYVHLTSSSPEALGAQFREVDLGSRPYTTDGRILVKPGASFAETETFKWKSDWDTTIDFLARRPPASVLAGAGGARFASAPGCELYFLFVGINPALREALGLERCPGYQELFGTRANSGSYAPIQFSPSDAPYAYLYQHPTERPPGEAGAGWAREIEGKIIELRCAGGCPAAGGGTDSPPSWQLARVREDRARDLAAGRFFGNNFRVAEMTWLNYVDPFPEAMLWEGPSGDYFREAKSEMHAPNTAFTSYIKSRRISEQLHRASWVVDLGVGHGQDLGRYLGAEVGHLVGVDRDRGALSELVQRKYSFAQPKRRGRDRRHHQSKHPMVLYAMAGDLSAPAADTAAKIRANVPGFPGGPLGEGGQAPDNGADAVVANLFLHYLAGTPGSLANFAALCHALVRVGGVVIITDMFGDRVHGWLGRHQIGVGEAWSHRVGERVKYSIRRDYSDDGLTAAGQQIGVVLPFTRGEYYEEYLLNVETLTEAFRKRGFGPPVVAGFETRFGDFKANSHYRNLTPADFDYLGLFGEVIFRREK